MASTKKVNGNPETDVWAVNFTESFDTELSSKVLMNCDGKSLKKIKSILKKKITLVEKFEKVRVKQAHNKKSSTKKSAVKKSTKK